MSNTKVQIRQDTAAQWTAKNPRLLQGEFGLETDGGGLGPRKKKLGDGVLFWNDLPYEVAMTDIDNGWQLGGNTVVTEQTFGTLDDVDIPFIIDGIEVARWGKVGAEMVLNLGISNSIGGNLLLQTSNLVPPWFNADEANGLKIRDYYGLAITGGVVTASIYNNLYAAIYAATANSYVSIISQRSIAIGHLSANTYENTDAVDGNYTHLGETNLSVRNAATIPTTEYVDGFLLYSADRSGPGTASPFILTEDGTLLDLYAMAGGGGTVMSVNSGTDITVDNTDPANPIINFTGSGSSLPAGTTGQTLYYAANGTVVTATSKIFNDVANDVVQLTSFGAGAVILDGTAGKISIGDALGFEYDFATGTTRIGDYQLANGGTLITVNDTAQTIIYDAINGHTFNGTGVTINGKLTVTGAIDPTHLYLDEQGGDPAAVLNKGILYTKDVSTVTQLFYIDSAGTVTQLAKSLAQLGGIAKAGDSGVSSHTFLTGQGIDTDVAAAVLNVGAVNATTLNLGTGAANTNINIGTAGTNAIVMGNTNSTITLTGNISFVGTAVTIPASNLVISDKLITLNDGGGAATGSGVGFEIEEAGSPTGYIKTTGGRDGFLLRAPANAADSSFLLLASSARSYTFPDTSGTVALFDANGNLLMGGAAAPTSTTNGLVVYSGTGPSGGYPADAFTMFSMDVAAGNAVPSFRTETGQLIRLYPGSAGLTTPQEINDRLMSMGLAAAGGVILTPAAQGGTGINNSTRTITVNTNPAIFTFSGAFTLTVAASASVAGTNTGDQDLSGLLPKYNPAAELTAPSIFDDEYSVYDASAAAYKKITFRNMLSQKNYVRLFDDFLNTPTQGNETGYQSAVSGGTVAAANGEPTHPGILALSTGTSTTGRAGIATDVGALRLGGGRVLYRMLLQVVTLSDGTETFTVRSGLQDVVTADSVDGVYFRYTHSVNSAQWELVARSNSVETVTNSTSAPAASTWYELTIDINAAGTSAEFFVNGSSIGTVASNIPTGVGRFTGLMPVNIIKSAGTTARQVQLDYALFIQEFTTAR